MSKKQMLWKTKGMNRDLSVSAFNPEFAFENMNLRLSTNDGNTLMSWVNEKGPSQLGVTQEGKDSTLVIEGMPVGTAVLNHYLVLFTTTNDSKNGSGLDRIYRLKYLGGNGAMEGIKLYEGNLNLYNGSPLETLVSYEAGHIQKVYWVDGRNQPRMINIVADSNARKKWEGSNTCFDFVTTFTSPNSVSVTKDLSSGGTFAPGVIQYCITYINMYGQQSNIVWQSPLYYLSYSDRGASPEDRVGGSFTININEADKKFDYVRLYAIQRTSLDATPFIRLIEDFAITEANGGNIVYTDNGTAGSSVDPMEMLYIGGTSIKALTMAQKDNTLFLGNISQERDSILDIQDYYRLGDKAEGFEFRNNGKYGKSLPSDPLKTLYHYTPTLSYNNRKITTFKGGEWYRFGFQLQKKTGEWSDPIFLCDKRNEVYPSSSSDGHNLVYADYLLDLSSDLSIGKNFDYSMYVKARPIVAYPNISEREVICQGVLNPTVFNVVDRKTSSPFAQASWYFRPYLVSAKEVEGDEQMMEDAGLPDFDTLAEANVTCDSEYSGPIEPDPNFTGHLNKPCYILYCGFLCADSAQEANIDTIIKSGILTCKLADSEGNPIGDEIEQAFDIGVVKEGFSSGVASFFFFKSSPWLTPYSITQQEGVEAYIYTMEGLVSQPLADGISFPIYDEILSSPSKHYVFYSTNTVVSEKRYYYRFSVFTDLFELTFTGVNSSSSDYILNSATEGSVLRYKHYDTLYSQEESENHENYDKYARQVEIQGSKSLIKSVYVRSLPDHPKTNTQFFIDQSIVTLNSPDLEFDTNVQNYDMSNIKLRIVGAIPITSSFSSHSIISDTPMLPTCYNYPHSAIAEAYGHNYGAGELPIDISYKGSPQAGKRLVADYLWNDSKIVFNEEVSSDLFTNVALFNYVVYPWQRTGSLNNDWRAKSEASSWLDTKKESTVLYSYCSIFRQNSDIINNVFSVNADIHLTENNYINAIRLKGQGYNLDSIDYYPNIDKVLYNSDSYNIQWSDTNPENDPGKVSGVISMRYNSTTHAVLALCPNSSDDSAIPILPSYGVNSIGQYTNDGKYGSTPYWYDSGFSISFDQSNISDITCDYNFLWLGELYREVNSSTIFGGQSKEALLASNWVIGGDEVALSNGTATLVWTDGDTYYQRYDCMKTYPRSTEDPNQLVEILSFMCESRVNIDGRYDNNRSRHDSYVLRPENFNLLNPVYSQHNNFFPIKSVWKDSSDKLRYPNLIWYSKTKTSGADVDLWTNVVLSSVLELDGDKGEIEKLVRFNNQLLSFQDSGLSRVSYNENTMISSTEGVPIELANSNKVNGSDYISDTIGCSNKWSVVSTPLGVYFIDSHDKSIYVYNGQLQNLSVVNGLNSWCKQNIPDGKAKWNPGAFTDFVGYYDKMNQEVLYINRDKALAYSERVGAFTSFYDYGGVPYFSGLDDTGVWVKNKVKTSLENEGTTEEETPVIELWKHQAGEYCNFFGMKKPYWMTLVGNPEPLTDKIFTNLEFRACVDGEGSYVSTNADTEKYVPYLPFDTLETWNEYQRGLANLSWRDGHYPYRHHLSDNSAHLARKFRIWRCDIPRDNGKSASVFDSTFNDAFHVPERTGHRNDRMRNPWLYLKLTGHVPEDNGSGGGTPIYKKDIVRFNTPHTLSASEIEEIRNWRSTGYELGFYVHSSLVRGVPSAETLKICVEGMLNGQLDVDEEYHYMEDSEGDYFLHDDGESDVFDTDHTFTVKARKLADSSEATVTVDICIHDYGNPMDIDTPHSSSDKRVEIHDVVMTYYN